MTMGSDMSLYAFAIAAILLAITPQGGKPSPVQQDELFAALGRLVAEKLA